MRVAAVALDKERLASIPDVAEDRFVEMCSLAGAVASRPHRDRHGWDYLVEFGAPDSDLPADLVPAGRKCFVQIKSKIRNKKSCQISLSNALRFTNNELPCFIVLMVYQTINERPKIYAKHFWQDDIINSLLLARQKHGGEKKINKINLTINFSEGDAADENLLEKLEYICKLYGNSYAQKKRGIVGAAGYENKRATLNVKFPGEVSVERFIDFQLGIVDRLPIESLDLKDERFGIPVTLPHPTGEGFVEVFPRPTKECLIKIKNASGGEVIKVAGGMFFPGIPNLESHLRKFRIKADFLDLVLDLSGNITVSWTAISDEERDIGDIFKLSAFRSWARKSGVELEIFVDGISIFGTSARFKIKDFDSLWDELYRFFSFSVLSCPDELMPPKLKFRIDDFIDIIDDIVIFNRNVLEYRLPMGGKMHNNVDGIIQSIVIIPFWIEIGNFSYTAFVERSIDSLYLDNDRIDLSLISPKIISGLFTSGKIAESTERINNTIKEIYQSHKNKNAVMIVFI